MTVATAHEIAERYARVRDEVGESVTVVVATKYVTLQEMSALVEGGVEVVGENRAQDLVRKHAVYGQAFRWHFIGQLQSNKVKVVNELCEEVGAYVARYPLIRGLMTMPPLTNDPESSRPHFRRLRELAAEHGLPDLSMGTSQDYRVAVEEGATLVRVGATIFSADRA
jgi:hypothetical protein